MLDVGELDSKELLACIIKVIYICAGRLVLCVNLEGEVSLLYLRQDTRLYHKVLS